MYFIKSGLKIIALIFSVLDIIFSYLIKIYLICEVCVYICIQQTTNTNNLIFKKMKKIIASVTLLVKMITKTPPINPATNEVYKPSNCEEIKEYTALYKSFVEVTEELFFEQLCAVPPIYLPNGIWQCGEAYSGSLHYTFVERNGKYYGCLCNANFAINNAPN
jgi:hypothetical protein